MMKPKYILFLLVMVQLIVMVYFTSQKQGYFMDEILTMGQDYILL